MNDPYKVLGVRRDATDEEIKKHTTNLPASTIPTIIQTTLSPTSLKKMKEINRHMSKSRRNAQGYFR